MDVDDPGKRSPFLISVGGFNPEDWVTANGDVHLRSGHEKCDHLQNICIAFRSFIESRGVNEGHWSSVENELVHHLDLGCYRLQAPIYG